MIHRWTCGAGVAMALALAGCGARGEPGPGAVPETVEGPLVLPDTMVLTMPGGSTVWLAEGRRAKDSTGVPCVERSVEVRRDTVKLKVPLLYTMSMPVMLDDSNFKADLSRDCRVSQTYRVNVRDGLPHRISP